MTPDRARLEAIKISHERRAPLLADDIPWLVERLEELLGESLRFISAVEQFMASPTSRAARQVLINAMEFNRRTLSRFEDAP